MTSAVDFASVGYQVVKQIGQGQFGSVLLLQRGMIQDDLFVCKVVLLDSLGESDRQLAEQEVKLLRGLDHRNIVKFHDCVSFPERGVLGLIMHYCDGGDLRHVIRNQTRVGRYFSESVVMTWFTQIVSGLRYIHGERIIHRDLKSSNIFLKGPPPYECLIGDFGISRVLECTLGAANTVIGTPYYLSPEVCKKDPYSFKSDIWSLGACLYEMAMLRMAFESSNLLSLVSKIINEDFEPIDTTAFSSSFGMLLRRLLSKDPQDRPSASDLLRHEYVIRYIAEEELAPETACNVPPPRPPSLRRPLSRSNKIRRGSFEETFQSAQETLSNSAFGVRVLLPGKLVSEETCSSHNPPPRMFF